MSRYDGPCSFIAADCSLGHLLGHGQVSSGDRRRGHLGWAARHDGLGSSRRQLVELGQGLLALLDLEAKPLHLLQQLFLLLLAAPAPSHRY